MTGEKDTQQKQIHPTIIDVGGAFVGQISEAHDSIDADEYLGPEYSIQEETKKNAEHARVKDRLVTNIALRVIAIAAVVSAIGLLVPILAPVLFDISKEEISADWPSELMRLTLVASLSFVMGSNS